MFEFSNGMNFFTIVCGIVFMFLFIAFLTNPKVGTKRRTHKTQEEIDELIKKIRVDYPDFDYNKFMDYAYNVIINDNNFYSKLDFSNMYNYETIRLLNFHKSEYNLALSKNIFRCKKFETFFYLDLMDYENHTLTVDGEIYISNVLINPRKVDEKQFISCNDETISFIFKDNKLDDNIVCPNCNAIITANNIGKCEYCGTTISTNKTDWILDKIKYSVVDSEENEKSTSE